MTNEQSIHLTFGNNVCTILPDRGGLVSSLKIAGREILWLPEDFSEHGSSWPGGGIPLCFPFAGRVWHQGQLYQYGLEGETYPMPLHGFGFGEPWLVKSSSSQFVHLELRDSQRTHALFPFSFVATMNITLSTDGLRIELKVKYIKALAHAEKMPIAFGFHPYFKLGAGQENKLHLDAKKYYPVTPVGAAGKVSITQDLGPKPWSIRAPLLNSLIFSDLPSQTVELKPGDSGDGVALKFGPDGVFHHVVVWSNRLEDFYCVEPWMSLPDAVAIQSGCKWLEIGQEINGWIEIAITERGPST